MTDEQRLIRAAEVMRQQTARIKELEAEVERLTHVIEGSCDALMVLQEIYSDPRNPPSVAMKAASCALAFERAKPPSTSVSASFSLFDLLEERRQRTKVIEAKPADPAA